METAAILSALERNEGFFPIEAVREAMSRREEITPALLKILSDVHPRPRLFTGADHMSHLYAMLLLSYFEEPQAYPLLLKIFSLPGGILDEMFGDAMTDLAHKCLAAVCHGDLTGLHTLIENRRTHEYVRAAAIDALMTLVATNRLDRDELMAYFLALFGRLEPKTGLVWNALVAACADLWPGEAMQQIRRAYERRLVEEDYVGLQEVEEALDDGREKMLSELAEQYRWISDPITELSDWACFHEDEEDEPGLSPLLLHSPKPEPVRNTRPNVGRNDPCPCGSGKKFKKCCGA